MDKQIMQQKFETTKKFVRTHKVKIAAAVGIVAGIAITLAVQQKTKPYDAMTLTIDEEYLHKLASDGGSVVFDDVNVRGPIHIRRPRPEDNFPIQERVTDTPVATASQGIDADYLNSMTNDDGSIIFEDVDSLTSSLGLEVIPSQK